MLGGAVGSSFDTIQGRQVGAMTSPRAQEGEPIQLVFGSARVTGRLIDVGKPVIKKEGGKGGPKVVNETAYLSYSILICESSELRGSSISGILMVYENNKIVYDTRSSPAISAAESAKFLSNKTFYFGGETQGTDPTEEMIHGAGNVPAYRGIARMVVHDENVTDKGGSIPTYEFVTTQCAATAGGGLVASDPRWLAIGQSSAGSIANIRPVAYTGTLVGVADGNVTTTTVTSIRGMIRYGDSMFALVYGLANYRVAALTDLTTWTNGPAVPESSASEHTGVSGARLFFWNTTASIYYLDSSTDTTFTATTASGGTLSNSIYGLAGNGTQLVAVNDYGQLWGSGDNGTTLTVGANLFGGSNRFYTIYGAIDVNGSRFLVAGGETAGRAFYTDNVGVSATECLFPSGVPGGTCTQVKYCGNNKWLIACGDKATPTDDGLFLSIDNGVNFYAVDLPVQMYFERQYNQSIAVDANSGRIVIAGKQHGTNAVLMYYTDLALLTTGAANTIWTAISLSSTAGPGIAEIYPIGSIPTYVGTPIPDSPGYYIHPVTGALDGPALGGHVTCTITLQSIVDTLDARAGIPSAKRDSSDLAGITVPGYAVDSFMTVAEAKEPLRRVWFFDVPEYDDAIHYRLRGKSTDFTVDPLDLIPNGQGFQKGQRGQTVEYPKRLHVQYVDPVPGYKPMKQTAERISPDIRVKGEIVAGANITLDANTANRAADIGLKSAWAEREDSRDIILPIFYWSKAIAAYTYSLSGRRYRITDMRLEAGEIYITSVYDRASAYVSTVVGTVGPTPTPPTPSIIGPTLSVLMNLPALRIADDGPGLYWAASGYPATAWYGAALQIQRGVAWETQTTAVAPAIIGTLASALPVADRDFTDTTNVLQVVVNGILNTAIAEDVYNGANVAAILYADGTAEIIQFQTATETTPGHYDLTTLQRGRLDTVIASHAIGASFVMLDASVRFIPLTTADIGATITHRAVAIGTDADAAPKVAMTLSSLKSLTEWSVTNLAKARDGSNNVTITWNGRPRLGTNVQPRQSDHFTGYRVEYTSGGVTIRHNIARTPLVIMAGVIDTQEVTIDTYTAAQQTTDFGTLPGSLAVAVSAINDQQGAGPTTGITA